MYNDEIHIDNPQVPSNASLVLSEISVNLITIVGSAVLLIPRRMNLHDFVLAQCESFSMDYHPTVIYLNFNKISIQSSRNINVQQNDTISLFIIGNTPDASVRARFLNEIRICTVMPSCCTIGDLGSSQVDQIGMSRLFFWSHWNGVKPRHVMPLSAIFSE